MKRLWLAVAVSGLLWGCASPPEDSTPQALLPAQYPGVAPAAAAAAADPRWWRAFADATLDGLVDAALAGNADLRLAAARVDEAASVLGLARSAQWPGLDLAASATRSRASALNGQPQAPGGPEATTHRLVLQTAFEIDLFGRLRNATAAAQAQMLAAQTARDTVRIALAATTVQAYFALRAVDAQLRVNEAAIGSRRESLQLVERRTVAGLASPLEPAQARAALAGTQAQSPELRRQRALLENQLGLLSGRPGLALAATDSALPAPATPPAGLPSALLERRPDVQQALAQLRAAQAQVEVARAALWPTLSLTGSLGGQSSELVDLLASGARIWSIGPALLLPLFDAGRSAARTAQARAQAEQAAIGYQKAAQAAFRDVADALATTEQAAAQEQLIQIQQTSAAEALRIATRRHAAGYSGYLEVLEAQRGAQEAEVALLRIRQARLDGSVALIKSLGGGWVLQPD